VEQEKDSSDYVIPIPEKPPFAGLLSIFARQGTPAGKKVIFIIDFIVSLWGNHVASTGKWHSYTN
jgi:hypothetical protein